MNNNSINWALNPYQILTIGFAGLILVGAILLTLPMATVSGESMPFIDALFTATSAVCVTGLVVVDTGTYFTLFGQVVIILLIQFGGLGIMTMSTLIFIIMRKKLQLRDRLIMQEALNQLTFSGIARMVVYIVKLTFCIELIGGTILALRFLADFTFTESLYYGYWHAISAFCNAGFDVIGSDKGNLLPYIGDPTINLALTTLIICGGLGCTVFMDLKASRNFRDLSLHTKTVLLTTFGLIVFGTLSIFLLEYNNPKTLADLPILEQLTASYFQAITSRTAGFATMNLAVMTHASIFLTMMLMFIGASPGSTGGGVKTTTFAVVMASLWSQLRGRDEAIIFYRTIPHETVLRAFTLFLIFSLLISLFSFIIDVNEPTITSSAVMFEVISAFSTTGLSLGITPLLGSFSKVMLILSMFIGRVGPITVGLAIVLKNKKTMLRYPEEKVSIG